MYKLSTPAEQEGYTKKEVGGWAKEKEKLEGFYGGVYQLTKKPDALFIVDSHLEDLAVREASRMGVVSVAITDTNSDPALVDYPIPANDDAVGSLELIIGYIMDAWIEGRNSAKIEKVPSQSSGQAVEAKAEKPKKTAAKKEVKEKTAEPKSLKPAKSEKKTKTTKK